jgi:hypothetical protein
MRWALLFFWGLAALLPAATHKPKVKTVLIDDFEDGDLVNRLGGVWTVFCDDFKMGTSIYPQPLVPFHGGDGNSKFALGVTGHIGRHKAPWPYAGLATTLSPQGAAVDLSPYKRLIVKVKGDGKRYEAWLIQDELKEGSYFRLTFTAGQSWAELSLPFKDFSQPSTVSPVAQSLVDLKALQFRPSGLDDQDFELEIDELRLGR